MQSPKDMDTSFLGEIMWKCKKRKWKFEEEVENKFKRAKVRFNWTAEEQEVNVLFHDTLSTAAVISVRQRLLVHVNLIEMGKWAKFGEKCVQ